MALLLGLAGIVVVLICTVPPTVFAWKQLRRQRALGLAEGRLPLLMAAWFWPVVAMTVLIVSATATVAPGLPVMLSAIGAVALAVWLIKRTQRWLDLPLNATQRRAFLDANASSLSQRSRTLTWSILAGGIILMICLGLAVWVAPDANARASIFALGATGSVLIAAYFWLVNRSYLPGSSAPAVPGYNPWPKRIFMLAAALFCLPIAVIGMSLLVPIVAYSLAPDFQGGYAVSVSRASSIESAPAVQLLLRRKSSGSVQAKVFFEGPPPIGNMQMNGNSVHLEPTSKVEWVLDSRSESLRTITFVLPDSKTGSEAASQMNIIAGTSPASSTLFPNIRLLPLFEVTKGADRYRAWVELRFDQAP